MAVGDDAADVGYPLVIGATTAAADVDQEINRSRDLLAQHVRDGGHAWGKISGRPAAFPPSAHGHAASQVTYGTGNVHDALNSLASRVTSTEAANSTQASQLTNHADRITALEGKTTDTTRYAAGPTPGAYGREAGANRYAVWMDGGLEFGRAVSSIRFKDDVEDLDIDVDSVLALRPVSFHYKADPAGVRDVGLIAEEVYEHVPQLVTFFGEADGVPQIDGVRYDLLAVAQHLVIRDLAARVAALEAAAATPPDQEA